MNTEVHPHFERQEPTDPISGHAITDVAGRAWLHRKGPGNGLEI